MAKIDINKDEKEAEEVIKRAVADPTHITKEQKQQVFKTITEIKSKLRADTAIYLKDLRRHPGVKGLTDSEIVAVLEEFDSDGKFIY